MENLITHRPRSPEPQMSSSFKMPELVRSEQRQGYGLAAHLPEEGALGGQSGWLLATLGAEPPAPGSVSLLQGCCTGSRGT